MAYTHRISLTKRWGEFAITASSTSIVVVSRNKLADLAACLESVRRLAPQAMKTVVVDNDSRDGSADMVATRFPEVCLIRSPTNSGAAGGRNLGAREAEGEILLFLDDDAEAFPGSLTAIDECFTLYPEVGIVCGKTFGRAPDDLLMSTGVAIEFGRAAMWDIGAGEADWGQYDEPSEVDACGAFAVAIRRDLFDELGGFDEAFNPYGWEDIDICLRARRAGYKTLYWPGALFRHKGTRQGRPSVVGYELAKAKNFFRIMQRHAKITEWVSCSVFLPLRGAKVLSKIAAGAMDRHRQSATLSEHQGVVPPVGAAENGPRDQKQDPTA